MGGSNSPARLQIVLITPRLIRGDGQGRVNYEIVRRLLSLGGRVTAVTGAVAPDLQEEPGFTWVPTGNASLPTSLVRSQFFSFQAGRWLVRHRSEFDAVHSNGSVTMAASDVNACHFVHGAWAKSEAHTSRYNKNAYGFYHRLLSALHSAQERTAYGRARCVVAISEQVRDQLVQVGVASSKIVVIWNGIDVGEFSPGTADRAKWNLPQDRFLALFAGDMKTPRKNLDTVLEALRNVPQCHLVVAGDLAQNPYPRLVETMGLADRVSFLGFRRDLADIMKAVDVFVYPARYEPLGLVVLEAMASGLPVITAATTGASPLVERDCGIVIQDPNDAAALEAALGTLASDETLRREMGGAARRRAEAHTWERMADAYIGLYETVARERPARTN